MFIGILMRQFCKESPLTKKLENIIGFEDIIDVVISSIVLNDSVKDSMFYNLSINVYCKLENMIAVHYYMILRDDTENFEKYNTKKINTFVNEWLDIKFVIKESFSINHPEEYKESCSSMPIFAKTGDTLMERLKKGEKIEFNKINTSFPELLKTIKNSGFTEEQIKLTKEDFRRTIYVKKRFLEKKSIEEKFKYIHQYLDDPERNKIRKMFIETMKKHKLFGRVKQKTNSLTLKEKIIRYIPWNKITMFLQKYINSKYLIIFLVLFALFTFIIGTSFFVGPLFFRLIV